MECGRFDSAACEVALMLSRGYCQAGWPRRPSACFFRARILRLERGVGNGTKVPVLSQCKNKSHAISVYCWVSCSNVLPGSVVSHVHNKINDLLILKATKRFNSVPGHHLFGHSRRTYCASCCSIL